MALQLQRIHLFTFTLILTIFLFLLLNESPLKLKLTPEQINQLNQKIVYRKEGQLSPISPTLLPIASRIKIKTLNDALIVLDTMQKSKAGQRAITILELLAYLDPTKISGEFVNKLVHRLLNSRPKNETDAKPFNVTQIQKEVDTTLDLLQRLPLILRTELDMNIKIESFVHDLVRSRIHPDLKRYNIIKYVSLTIGDGFQDKKYYFYQKECNTHGEFVFPYFIERDTLILHNKYFVDSLCYSLVLYENFQKSLEIAQIAAVKYETIFERTDEVTLSIKDRVAWAADELGNHTAALKIYEEIYPQAVKTLGPWHPTTTYFLSNMGIVLITQERYEEALDLFQNQLLPIEMEVYGNNSVEVTESFNSVGTIQQHLGREDEALKLYEFVYAFRLKTYGADAFKTKFAKKKIDEILSLN